LLPIEGNSIIYSDRGVKADEISFGRGEGGGLREGVGRSSRWLFSYTLNAGLAGLSRRPGLVICLIPRPLQRSLFAASPLGSELFPVRHLPPPPPPPPPRRGGHLAVLFSVSIVAGPSLSPVDVTRSTGTRSHALRRAETETRLRADARPGKNADEIKLNAECILVDPNLVLLPSPSSHYPLALLE